MKTGSMKIVHLFFMKKKCNQTHSMGTYVYMHNLCMCMCVYHKSAYMCTSHFKSCVGSFMHDLLIVCVCTVERFNLTFLLPIRLLPKGCNRGAKTAAEQEGPFREEIFQKKPRWLWLTTYRSIRVSIFHIYTYHMYLYNVHQLANLFIILFYCGKIWL